MLNRFEVRQRRNIRAIERIRCQMHRTVVAQCQCDHNHNTINSCASDCHQLQWRLRWLFWRSTDWLTEYYSRLLLALIRVRVCSAFGSEPGSEPSLIHRNGIAQAFTQLDWVCNSVLIRHSLYCIDTNGGPLRHCMKGHRVNDIDQRQSNNESVNLQV